ncbi:MAG: DUF429 domain-containing protein, partial [Gammaproteobacteria bacterium]|nr:DUF429 domain-containing protein [Gammaproteobacteria bacterium]
MKSAGSGSGTAFGVDGCKAGWFVLQTFGELVDMANEGDRIFVDIPIGLGDGPEERLCDREARR